MGGLRCLFRDHSLEIHVDHLALEDAERTLRWNILLMFSHWSHDTYRGVVDGKFFVLLEGFAQRVQAVADEVFEVACPFCSVN